MRSSGTGMSSDRMGQDTAGLRKADYYYDQKVRQLKMFIYKGKLKVFDHSYSKELSKIIHQDYEIGIKPSNHKNISYRLEQFLVLNGVRLVI